MRYLWCDVETTGIDAEKFSAFQIAFILVDNGKDYGERCFKFNPLFDKILYDEDAGKIHGYTREQIESLPPESEIAPNIIRFLNDAANLFSADGGRHEKMVFAGYNSDEFDWNHVKAVLERNGARMEDYFRGKADVFRQVKSAGTERKIPWLTNRKLETVCAHLGINMDKAHDALSDIRATREVAKTLHRLGVPLVVEEEQKQGEEE